MRAQRPWIVHALLCIELNEQPNATAPDDSVADGVLGPVSAGGDVGKHSADRVGQVFEKPQLSLVHAGLFCWSR